MITLLAPLQPLSIRNQTTYRIPMLPPPAPARNSDGSPGSILVKLWAILKEVSILNIVMAKVDLTDYLYPWITSLRSYIGSSVKPLKITLTKWCLCNLI